MKFKMIHTDHGIVLTYSTDIRLYWANVKDLPRFKRCKCIGCPFKYFEV